MNGYYWKWYWDGVEWGLDPDIKSGKASGHYYIYWWNVLPREYWYWGPAKDWYDGPISSFGLGPLNISWRTPWTNHDGGII